MTSAELEKKRESMLEQDHKRLDPQSEVAELLATVRSDNIEVSAIEQQIKDTAFQIESLNNQLKEIDQVVIL